PIIKQFLYSDHEIFLRELVSNAVDATMKLETLGRKGEVKGEIGNTTIEVKIDADKGTLTISDRGIGMTAEEVEKYLNQVAFSGAKDFLEKYKDEANIIGHFGLGFYSAFMVAKKVEVITKSFQEGSQGVTWTCEGNPEYTLEENDKAERGTDIVLHIAEDSGEFLEENRIGELLNKYCKFLPVEIKFGTKEETITEGEGEEVEEKKITVDNIINNPNPIWKKAPSELEDEDYKAFYRELYPMTFQDPLFWIHLNIDYPFNLTGILYFPHLNGNFELQKNKIQLYSNQVYITDNVSDIVPEFLTLLHGVIDSPDIPLNVSRSYLQADGNVKKISGYISKKVSDKLNELFKADREAFEAKWGDVGVFVKYGLISDDKFYDRSLKFTLVKNTDDQFHTIEDYKEHIKESQTDKYNKVVMLYSNSPVDQHTQIEACKSRGYEVLVFDHVIDNHFMQQIEGKMGDVTFVRVDSETVDNLIQKDETTESVLSEDDQKQVEEVFKTAITDTGASVSLKALSPDDQPITITRPEFMRRMREMQAMQGGGFGDFPEMYNVVVNSNHELIANKLLQETDADKKAEMAKYLFNLAQINHGMLRGADLDAFVKKSLSFLG
ncbi:MAG: molecular chaperone HtpG, partial [Bacteroidota bacterium]